MDKHNLALDYINAENSIMFAMIYNYKDFPLFLEFAGDNFFKEKVNQDIYKVIKKLYNNGEDWDLVKLCVNMPKSKNHILTVNLFEENSKNTRQALGLIKSINEKDTLENTKKKFELYSKELNSDNLDNVMNELINTLTIKQDQNEVIKSYLEQFKSWLFAEPDCITTPLTELNHILNGGFTKSDVHVIAGRPGQGKTALVCTLINHSLEQKRNVGFISVEMDSNQILLRLMSNKTGIDSNKIMTQDLNITEVKQIDETFKYYQNANLILSATTLITGIQIFNKIKLWKIQYNIDEVYIDYLGLIQKKGKANSNKTDDIEEIMQWIKFAAKENHVAIILLSQLNREVENRASKHSFQLSDLRDSGSIEQDASTVSFLVRPEFYGVKEVNGISTKGLAILSVLKNRYGKTGSAYLKFINQSTKFENYFQEQPNDSNF